jgi:hypothetical protein
MYQRASGNDLEDVDDQALMYKLVETGYGKAEGWTTDTLKQVGPNIMAQMPSEFLKNLNPETVSESIDTLKSVRVSLINCFLHKSHASYCVLHLSSELLIFRLTLRTHCKRRALRMFSSRRQEYKILKEKLKKDSTLHRFWDLSDLSQPSSILHCRKTLHSSTRL